MGRKINWFDRFPRGNLLPCTFTQHKKHTMVEHQYISFQEDVHLLAWWHYITVLPKRPEWQRFDIQSSSSCIEKVGSLMQLSYSEKPKTKMRPLQSYGSRGLNRCALPSHRSFRGKSWKRNGIQLCWIYKLHFLEHWVLCLQS